MKLWVDDLRPAPDDDYVVVHSVREAISQIMEAESMSKMTRPKYKAFWNIELIDIDHDAGDYAHDGGDYIAVLNWLEETGRNYPIRIHSMNPVGVENMRRIIQRNGWTEVM